MLNPKTFLKLPHNFKNKFKIFPPSITEVIGTEEFGMYQKIFTISQEELEDEFIQKGKEIKKNEAGTLQNVRRTRKHGTQG